MAAGRYQVLSLDVFDTLLWRRVPEAADVFLLLGRALAADGKLAAHVSPLGFADLRRAAERAAREKVEAVTGYREITLADIYADLPDHLFAPGFDRPARVAAELACERGLTVLDRELVALLKAAKAGGARVILVSDTYFTSAQLWDILAAAGFNDKSLIDRLYVSCESGKPKYRDLFDVILADQAVAPGAMIHVGDTLEADIGPARARGIAVAHYDKWGYAPRMQTVEFPANRETRATLLGDHGDFGLTGLRARLAHRPPADLSADLKPYWSYGAAVLAPIFAAFARWIIAENRASGATRVFGLMREGRFLKRLIEATASDLQAPPAVIPLVVEELWLSRRAVVRAALYDDDLSLLPEAILLTPGTTTDGILRTMGLDRAELNAVLPGYDIAQADALGNLSRVIATTPALKEKVLAVSASLRANLLKGLAKKLDLAQAETVVFLDLGYAATIQSVLARILEREGAKIKLTGLYLALNEKAMAHVRGGADLRAFLGGEGFQGATSALLSRTPDVLEHACMCREGSLIGYDDAGNALLLPNQRATAQLTQMEAMQDGIIAGVAAVNALIGGLARAPAAALSAQVARMIHGLLVHPTPQEAATIGSWQHEANFDLTDLRRLADLAFNPTELEYRGWPALQNLGRHQVYWPAAALTAANVFVGTGFAQGLEAAYRVAHLTAGPLLGGVVICPDIGAGFDSKREGAVPLAINAFGRGHMQVMIKPFGPEAYRRLRLTWPSARAVVQIDHISAAYFGESEQRPAALAPVVWIAAAEISPGLRLIKSGKAGVAVVDLGAPPPFAHALELTLRFKYLRLDPVFGAN